MREVWLHFLPLAALNVPGTKSLRVAKGTSVVAVLSIPKGLPRATDLVRSPF